MRRSRSSRPEDRPRLPRGLPPLRITLPLVLLVFAVTLGLYDLRQSSRFIIQRTEAYTLQELTHRLSEKQGHLELLLSQRELGQVQGEIASLGSDPYIETALLLDETGTVVASTRRVELGQPGRALHPELYTGDGEQQMGEARQHLTATVRVTPDGGALMGYYPVLGPPHPGKLTPSTVWILVVKRDLTALKGQGIQQMEWIVLHRTLQLGLLAGLLWLFFYFVITRRVDRLVTTAHRFAARDWSARTGLTGRDELSVVGHAFDEMTGRLQVTQTQLEKSESHTRLLLDSTAEGIYGLDLDGHTTFVNRSAVELLGYPDANALLGHDAHEQWHYAHADGTPYPRSECPILRVLHTGLEDHHAGDVLWRRDGTCFPVERWSYPMHQGDKLIGLVSTFVDITERKRAEEAQRFLIGASTQLAELLDEKRTLERVARLAIPQLGQWCIVDTMDDAGRIHRAAGLHQDPARQALLQELARCYPPDGDTFQLTAWVLRTGQALLAEEATHALRHAGDSDAEYTRLLQGLGVRSAIALPFSVRGETLAALLLVSDKPGFQYGPHELELARELARRASVAMDNARLYRQSLDAVHLREEFLSVASHELHTPLTPLRLHLQTLQRSLATSSAGESPTRLLPKVDKALGQVKRLSHLVDDLLDVSRLTTGRLDLHPEEVDLVEMTQELAERFCEQARAAGSPLVVTAEGPTLGHWDRMRLDQVLTNLISNALKYGPGHPVELHVASSGRQAYWSIRDHGIGISSTDLDRIFGRFERAVSTRKYGGLGLGLYISRQIVRAHGGNIYVESQPGDGALFTVELPLEAALASRGEWEARAPEPGRAAAAQTH